MDFKSVEYGENKVILKDAKNFNIKQVFECGQCFRWERTESGSYIGVAFGKVIELAQEGNDVIIYNTNMLELWLSLKFWHIFLFLTDTESYEVDTQCIFRESILMIICGKCTKII